MKMRLYREGLDVKKTLQRENYNIQRKNYMKKKIYRKKLYYKELYREKLYREKIILYKKRNIRRNI